jgi:aminopeptidase N
MQQTALHIANTKPVVQGEEVDTDETYQPDIYGKGAFFMHTLRFVIGDNVFFPALKKLATGSHYTYDSLVTTEDVERLFSGESKQSLKPLFDLYLRSTQKVDFNVKQLTDSTFTVKFINLEGPLPVQIGTSQGIHTEQVTNKGIPVTSHGWPQVDPNVYYFKRVTLE